MDLPAQLARGIEALAIDVTAEQQRLLLEYLDLLVRWNKAYNLTAVRDPAQMVTRHLLDSLAVAPYLEGERCIDVGTGGGLPGVPMAILFPERELHLLDGNGKKTRFLFQVKTSLGLAKMSVHHARAESFSAPPFNAVLTRAFASLAEMVEHCRHLLAPGGRFLAMKGVYPGEELSGVAQDCTVCAVHELRVPGLDEARHLVELALK
ncbi:MAG: 16S rRNA (guanine(527)-N(7))-methyltransferase RsmG [Halioglobus sp.]|nr:16S rRNA (guanine(527)-N(7))-methyltransferase RsmG [Halioglobus sp.]